jgi:galactokinase
MVEKFDSCPELIQGVLNHHFTDAGELPIPVDLLVTGSVPAGSGLSSSAAMVVASTLAFLAVNEKVKRSLLEESHYFNTLTAIRPSPSS